MKEHGCYRTLSLCTICVAIATSGCHVTSDPPAHRRMFEPILPQHVEVVAGLSQPTSLDDDALPEGLSVVLRTTDAQGDPAKVAGRLVFELYTHRPASADPRGALIQTWTRDMGTAEDQTQYWNRITRMYEFPLGLDVTAVPRSPKYVVHVRYTTPWQTHIEDQATLDFTELLAKARRQLRGENG